ncbi:MAG TPA: LanC-like protein [Polyangiaceae bacterium]|nr:LanC-like protein [Polyangiaceae bacterium]
MNTFPDFDELGASEALRISTDIRTQVDAAIPSLVREIQSKVGPIAEASDPRFSVPDFTLYAGAGGVALSLWAAHQYLRDVAPHARLARGCLTDCHRALACALELTQTEDGSSPGFYCGTPGVHALAAVVLGTQDPPAAAEHMRRVLDGLDAALGHPETELLFGRAGYLHSLLVLRRSTPPELRPPELESALAAVFDSLIRDGALQGEALARRSTELQIAPSLLAFRFPAKNGNFYGGAAHGLGGVLYVLMQLPELCSRPGTRALVAGAVDGLLALQSEQGNFPTLLGGSESPREADLVHWCHGAPGMLPTLCKAYELFGEDRYLDAARRAADCVWSHGILRKGLGICHGIAGSVLSLLTVYRATQEERYLYRALRLCETTWCDRCLDTIRSSTDRQRHVPGMPDLPFSLMEGRAGVLYTYVSILRPDSASFPGYDTA